MSKNERLYRRPLEYSWWHREVSGLLLPDKRLGFLLGMIDLDGIEYCPYCYMPLALVETYLDVGQEKPTTVLRNLALKANTPAYLLGYKQTAKHKQQPQGIEDITEFKLHEVYPKRSAGRIMQPQEYAMLLLDIRRDHAQYCPQCRGLLNFIDREVAKNP